MIYKLKCVLAEEIGEIESNCRVSFNECKEKQLIFVKKGS